jgi:hypothetical protein
MTNILLHVNIGQLLASDLKGIFLLSTIVYCLPNNGDTTRSILINAKIPK